MLFFRRCTLGLAARSPLFCAISLCGFTAVSACDKDAPPTAAPVEAAAPAEAPAPAEPVAEEAAAEAEEEAAAPLVGEDAIAVGVLNTEWGHDHAGKRRPKQSQLNRAKTEADWEWKVGQLADVLAKTPLDIIVLTEIGGERELGDLQLALRARTGTTYDYAVVKSEDTFFGHNVGVLSKFDVKSQSRVDAKVPTQLIAELELESGDTLTVAAFVLRSGDNENNVEKRVKQAKSFKRRVNLLAKKGPVLVMGTSESNVAPGDNAEYRQAASGILAGANTRSEDTDDCLDSGKWAAETTVTGELRDHIFACGIEMRKATSTGRDMIVRGEVDPDEIWSTIPIDEPPQRDSSDHVLLWAEIVLPGGDEG